MIEVISVTLCRDGYRVELKHSIDGPTYDPNIRVRVIHEYQIELKAI